MSVGRWWLRGPPWLVKIEMDGDGTGWGWLVEAGVAGVIEEGEEAQDEGGRDGGMEGWRERGSQGMFRSPPATAPPTHHFPFLMSPPPFLGNRKRMSSC